MTEIAITAAIVGAEVTRQQTPYVPYSAEELAKEAKRCASAGASIIHLHVREQDGRASQSEPLFREAIKQIRAACDVVIQVSTGGAVGMSVRERLGGVLCDPEMATLNCGSINFGDEIFENSLPQMREIAREIQAHKLVPELELYELGHLDNALLLEKEGLLSRPFFVQWVLGVRGAMAARESIVRFAVSELPKDAHWGVAGIGRYQLPMAELSARLGGHIRVGLEDNIYLDRGVLAEGSAPLVERAASIAKANGRTPVSAVRVREWLKAQ